MTRARILVVQSEREACEDIENKLKNLGYTVLTPAHSKEETFKKNRGAAARFGADRYSLKLRD